MGADRGMSDGRERGEGKLQGGNWRDKQDAPPESSRRFTSAAVTGSFARASLVNPRTSRIPRDVLVRLFRDRLSPEEWYPAHESMLSSRFLAVARGERVRVVEGGDPAQPLVAFVHGWGASAYFYRKLLPTVVDAGFRVAAIDLRGHGGSDKPKDSTLYTAPAMADHLESVLDVLGSDRLALVAHSLGGGVSLDVASRRPDRLSSLTLLAPVGLASLRFVGLARFFTPGAAASLVQYAVPPWTVPVAIRALNGTLGDFAMRDVDEYWAPSGDPAFGWALRALLHQFRLEPRGDEELAALRMPVLAMFGGQDMLVRATESAQRARALPNAQVQVVTRAGHVLAEEVPQAVLESLLPHLTTNR
jgi:pimeloyl-ACP methyl ester carboxylesterase